MSGGNESLDPRGMIIASFAGSNPMNVFLRYQASMFRLWADNCELMARNYEKGLEAFNSASEQRREAA